MHFDEILYNDQVLDALEAMHFDECTPIQEQAIPVVEQGRDLIAVAQTGTGKTAAYLLPVIDILADGGYPSDAINCLVMAPTRELAMQIDQQLQGFSYFLPVSGLAIYGGTDGKTFTQQKEGLVRGADIVIATPGRLIDHIQMGYVDLSQVSFFILDEADRMLDMGFYDDIMRVVAKLPKDRQTLMFSATMPPKIKNLAQNILNDPVEVKIAINKPADNIEQSAYVAYERQKEPLLLHIFKQTPPDRVIVFASSKLKVKDLARALRRKHIDVAEMHSDLEQDKRNEVMLNFKNGKVKVLVATDIVARGIDIDNISAVINYDVPHDAEDYVHRIGRTARAGAGGKAITLISEKDRQKFRNIESLIEKEVPKIPLPADLGEGPDYSKGERHGKGRGRADKPRRQQKSAKSKEQKPKPQAKEPNAPKTEQPTLEPKAQAAAEKSSEAPKPKKRRWHRHRKPSKDKEA